MDADLNHHGDRELATGLVDFAVNVRAAQPPRFVAQALRADVEHWASYPNTAPARAALAQRWGVNEEMVLPTNGAAEAFTLIASALTVQQAAIVHPQFTEPEAALRRAGHRLERILLTPDFALHPEAVGDGADLVVVGNPTNPTGVLHPRGTLRALCRPGRVVVIDEAFLDELGDHHSLIAPDMPGLLVVRSLTKAFSAAGVRAGYVVGDPSLIARLAAPQVPWSVSAPAVTLMQVACTDAALRFIRGQAATIEAARADLVAKLHAVGLEPVPSRAPFVLVDTSSLRPHDSLRAPLARRGFAVRRGETFPGLGPTWLRLAVRTPSLHAALAEALRDSAGDA